MLYSPGHKFVNPQKVLIGAGLRPGMVVGDFGAGGGFYSTAAANIVGSQGKVLAVDVQETALRHLMADARVKKLRNVSTYHCDLEKPDFCPVEPVSCDVVILANILHQAKDKKSVIASSYRALKSGGYALVIEWEPHGAPWGPSAEARVSEQDVAEWFTESGFKPGRKVWTDPYHYAVTYIK